MDAQKLQELQAIIDKSANIVFFGGAGVSTESGIPDFRSEDGLYSQKYKYPPEMMVSRSFYDKHTKEFFEFYRDKLVNNDAKPNPAHLKLAELERAGKLKAVVTQNVDGLHQQAGSQNVIELHGSVHRNFCRKCHRVYPLEKIIESAGVPTCECGGQIKPDVVLYEEMLDPETISEAVRYIGEADLLIIGGTSMAVYPAAGLVDYFSGGHIVLINRDVPRRGAKADLIFTDPIGEVLGAVLSR